MQKIDTEYESLSQIDPEIVRFYSVDDRTRLVDFEEMDADGYAEPIYEDYTVIVLNKPDEVTYDYMESRRGLRWPEDKVMALMPDAIAWEDFAVNHDGYLDWLNRPTPQRAREEDGTFVSDDPQTDVNDAWVNGFTQEDYDAQERPVVDMNVRRAVYHKIHETHERDQWCPPAQFAELIDDDNYVITTSSLGASDEDWEAFLADPSPEYVKYLKLVGIEFEGVMCSVTKEDMWGLSSVEAAVRAGQPVNFNFDSGETLVLTPDNIDAFQAVWVPFRLSFFQ